MEDYGEAAQDPDEQGDVQHCPAPGDIVSALDDERLHLVPVGGPGYDAEPRDSPPPEAETEKTDQNAAEPAQADCEEYVQQAGPEVPAAPPPQPDTPSDILALTNTVSVINTSGWLIHIRGVSVVSMASLAGQEETVRVGEVDSNG